MLGYDASWASFSMIEVMSQPRFAYKRIGYLAASQTFTKDTDVILLCTQLFSKEFRDSNPYEMGLAINCLSNICNEDLAKSLLKDVTVMLTSSRPYIRKKAVLVLYKMFLQFPQGLRLAFDQLKRRLHDDSRAVQSCAVNVICELARRKPANYLSLAPDLFGLLTNSHNNWMLIKVVKLLGQLVGEEPRLARKLLAPLAQIITTTPAKSLLYVRVAVSVLVPAAVCLCLWLQLWLWLLLWLWPCVHVAGRVCGYVYVAVCATQCVHVCDCLALVAATSALAPPRRACCTPRRPTEPTPATHHRWSVCAPSACASSSATWTRT